MTRDWTHFTSLGLTGRRNTERHLDSLLHPVKGDVL